MSSFLKKSDRYERFNCSIRLLTYKCNSCCYKTHEKVRKSNHKCGAAFFHPTIFKQCRGCKTGSYSIAWQYYHERKCKLNNSFLSRMKKILSKKLIQCDHCHFTTTQRASLKKHKFRKHINLPLEQFFKCNTCAFTTNEAKDFESHIHTLESKRFQCDECGFETRMKSVLESHKGLKHVSIELQKWINCQKCEYRTTQMRSLILHEASKHDLGD